MKRSDWLLTYIAVPISKSEPVDRMQIMKGLFLMRMETKKAGQLKELDEFYTFKPYLYGPYSFDVYDDLDALVEAGHIKTSRQPGNPWIMYSLTESGKKKVKQLCNVIPDHLLNRLHGIKKLITGQSIWDTLRKVYEEYPEYTGNSVIKRNITGG